ncbi:hypothetical protein Tco_1327042 [Tanacetum coccineum]
MDEEMKDAEVAELGKGEEESTDAAKADAENSEKVKDDNKKAELPSSSFRLSVSSGFGNQFLNLSSDKSTVGNLKNSVDVIPELTILSPKPEIPTETPATTLQPPPSVSTIIPVLQQQSTPILTCHTPKQGLDGIRV